MCHRPRIAPALGLRAGVGAPPQLCRPVLTKESAMWFGLSRKPRPAGPARPRVCSARPRLEALEDRCLLSAGALDPTFSPAGSPPGLAIDSAQKQAHAVLVQPSG